MRRSPLEEGKRWLRQAREDLKWARRLAEEGGYYLACFLAQQIGEKALKALLYASGEENVPGHSIHRLATEASAIHEDLAGRLSRWSILDTFYIPTRYPGGLPEGIPAEVYGESAAAQALTLVAEIVQYVEDKLAGQV
ncbi:MAG TPA: DNA-binding protein [Clostridiales bacterium UBA8153]|nr:DNA-binding protein [Clostridiales bacterium UBA8153]